MPGASAQRHGLRQGDAHGRHAIQQYCDYWWVVAPSINVVPLAELPPNWGLLVPHGKSLRAEKEAPKLEPVPLDRLFVASVLRNVRQKDALRDVVHRDAQTMELRAELRAELEEQHRKPSNAQSALHEQQLQRLERSISDFEAASGVRIDAWQAGKIGEAVRFVVAGHMDHTRRALAKMAEDLRRRGEELQRLWEALEAEAWRPSLTNEELG